MRDATDIEPVRAALARLGLPTTGQLNAAQQKRLLAVLAKAEAVPMGSCEASATRCWMIRTLPPPVMHAPLSAARLRG